VKFIVDAHLPPALAGMLRTQGHDAIHTRELAAGNRTRDGEINDLSLREHRVVVTKDTEFYHSHILQGRPWKLLLVRTGNIGTEELQRLVERHLPAIVAGLKSHTLVELDRKSAIAIKEGRATQ
jgi:predicted nuclease of predicted toxin-antitoxin system